MTVKNIALLLSFGALAACATPAKQPRPIKLSANPSALVAQDIAASRLASEKGQWTALREHAAPKAVMFVPDLVNAQTWLKEQKDPAESVRWQPHHVYMSCDGKTGVTRGAWHGPDGKHGQYTTVWQRFENRKGEGRWFFQLDDNITLKKPLKAPEFIGSHTASCKGKASIPLSAPPAGVTLKKGLSYDQSLSWSYTYRPDKSRDISVALWDGEKMNQVFSYSVDAP